MTTTVPSRAPAQVSRCPTKGCPTVSGSCAFHAGRWPSHFRDTDRLIRQRPGDSERGGR